MLKVSDIQTAGSWAVLLCLMACPVLAQDELNLTAWPKYQAPVPYAGERNWHVTQNMGATGVRFWVAGQRGDSAESRELLVKSVEPGSPADGVLQPYDVIVGAAVPPNTPTTTWKQAPDVKKFAGDARLAMMRALTWAESDAGKGKLQLLRFRDGQTQMVTLQLPVMGTYAETAPYDCPKTEKIVSDAAAFLASHMPVEGFVDLPGAHAAMLLYASGDDRYLDHVRRSAMRMAEGPVSDMGHETWRWGNVNTFLGEYYLATGDQRVLNKIKGYSDALAAGQCNPGTWGHRAVPDFIPPGYGSLNASGVVCFLSLILADQAGVEFDTTAIERSIRFYGSYAGRGSIPYGDHPPGNGPSANGKNGMAAVAFYQLGADPAAQWFARLSASSNLHDFEGGHTGNFFNQTWAPLGASLAGTENYQQFWSRFNSYRDMARRWDGSFVTQPWTHRREGDLGTGNYVKAGPMWNTGGFALSYLAGTNRLAILGRRDSVFAANPPRELEPALASYQDKKFEKAAALAGEFTSAGDERLATLAAQLQNAAERNIKSLELTLADMQANLDAGDLYELKMQLRAIESIMDADDPRLAAFREAVNDSANEPIMETGKQYHAATKGPRWVGPLGFQIFAIPSQANADQRKVLETIATSGPQGYRQMAMKHLATHPWIQIMPDTALFDPNQPAWRLAPADVKLADDWFSPAFDDSGWQTVKLPSEKLAGRETLVLRRTFGGVDASQVESLMLEYTLGKGETIAVYLNGQCVMENTSPGWPGIHQYPLKPNVTKLLKDDTNDLAVKITPGKAYADFNLMLKAKFK